MEPYASQLSGSSLGAPLYSAKSTSCWNKGSIAKACGALVAVLLLAAAVGLGLYFVGDDDNYATGGGGSGPVTNPDGTVTDPSAPTITRPDGSTGAAPPPVEEIERKPILANPVAVEDISTEGYHWPYDRMLGDTFLFYETQRSGAIEDAPGGSRIPWRKNHLLKDGNDATWNGKPADLTGGHYEAGNRLKITFPESYFVSRLAWSCLYQGHVYEALTYDGANMLSWCEREVKWAAQYLLKMQLWDTSESAKRPAKWGAKDRLVVQVGTLADFDCYKRAENMPTPPGDPRCPLSARATLIANVTSPAADSASYAAAACTAAAALLQKDADNSALATELMTAASAYYDFANRYNGTAMDWSDIVFKTYPLPNSDQTLVFAEAMFAYVMSCKNDKLPVCNFAKSQEWLDLAQEHFFYRVLEQPKRHREHMISYWGNPDYDSALLLTMASGNISTPAVRRIEEYIGSYTAGEDILATAGDATSYIGRSPLGMRYHKEEEWAFLRICSASAFIAATYASLPGVSAVRSETAYCYARSQLGYIVGETTDLSYVAGFGRNFVTEVHHRDSVCTLEEDSEEVNTCDQGEGKTRKFFDEIANAYVVYGAVVGGPNIQDQYANKRNDYRRTEIALDYDTLYTTALAALAAAPSTFWATAETNCPKLVKNYPWAKAFESMAAFKADDNVPNPMSELDGEGDAPPSTVETADFGPVGDVPESSLGAPPPPPEDPKERPRVSNTDAADS